MKRVLLMLSLATALGGTAVLAQNPPATPPSAPTEGQPPAPPKGEGRGERMKSELKHLSKTLQLDDSQKKMVKAILKERREQMEKLSPEQRRGEVGKKIREDSHAKVRALLNPEQQKKFDAWVVEMKEHHKKGRAGKGPGHDGPPPATPPAGQT